jgi:hypothetical protein
MFLSTVFSRARILLIGGLLLTSITGCESRQVELLDPLRDGSPAELALATASHEFGDSQKGADDYAAFASAVRPHLKALSGHQRQMADANLAFFAIPPSLDAINSSPLQHVRQMGATVWATTLKDSIGPDETAEQYVERLCELNRDGCAMRPKEQRPRFVIVVAMQTLKHRAERAYQQCVSCQEEPSYQTQLARLNQAIIEMQAVRRPAKA